MKICVQGEKTGNRFWGKVEKQAPCWIWRGAVDRKGFGMFSVGGSYDARGKRRNSMVLAHRFSFELKFGQIPEGEGHHGTCVLHRCLNLSCVNPDHLFLGTSLDSVRHMDARGRRVCNPKVGEAHAGAKLTEKDVRAIVSRYRAGGITQKQLAVLYGVCGATVNHIFRGRLWTHLGLANETGVFK